MKKLFFLLTTLFLICSCSVNQNQSDKIKITATIFPQYDFSRQIAGDLADVTMLLPPGGESHTFEPTPQDIMRIEASDIFIYTGGESDSWIENILSDINNPDLKIICLADICGTDSDNHHIHTADEHVWTSPENAKLISKEICNVLSEIDKENASVYQTNFSEYEKELESVCKEFEEISKNSKRNALIFGDRFPFKHLADEYGFEYVSAFPGCSEDTEPDIKTVKSLIDKVKTDSIPVVFYTDFSNHKIADTISKETGARLSMLRSCHTVTTDELKNGTTYIDLMKQNAKNIKEALN